MPPSVVFGKLADTLAQAIKEPAEMAAARPIWGPVLRKWHEIRSECGTPGTSVKRPER
jgi:hypothetical protein